MASSLRIGALAALLSSATPALAEPAPSPQSSVPTPVLALWITGGVGMAVGVSFGINALVHQSRANDTEAVGGQREIGATQTSQLIANVGYGVGLASLAAGLIVLRLFGERAVTVVPSTESVALVVRF